MKISMIEKTKRVLNSFHNKLKRIIQKENENMALQLLDNLKPLNIYIPATSYSLTPSLIVHVLNDIVINKRKNILEFGAGLSTFYIANLIKKNQLDVKFYSVDSSAEWIDIVKKNLKGESVLEYVNLIHCPLAPSNFNFKEHNEWYDTKVLDKHLPKESFDMVIVDGPWGKIKYSRFGAIQYLLPDKLNNKFFIVLDDSHRIEELEIIEKWQTEIGGNIQSFSNYSILSSESNFNSSPIFSIDKNK